MLTIAYHCITFYSNTEHQCVSVWVKLHGSVALNCHVVWLETLKCFPSSEACPLFLHTEAENPRIVIAVFEESPAVFHSLLCFRKITSQMWHGMTLVHRLVHDAIQASPGFNQIKSPCWKNCGIGLLLWKQDLRFFTPSKCLWKKAVLLKQNAHARIHSHNMPALWRFCGTDTHSQHSPGAQHIYLWAQLRAWNLNMLC